MRSSRTALATAMALVLFAPQVFAEEVEETSTEVVQEAAAAPEVESTTDTKAPELGPVGLDEEGRTGRIHVVVPGDTLWDISDAYLGTPWVWPSVWRDNQGIENPHLIFPGDRIWITATEMRKVSKEEAEKLLSAAPSENAVPASMADASTALGGGAGPGTTYRFAKIDATGFVTREEFEGTTTIVDSHEPKVWLGESDTVIIGRGAGEVEVGDQFEIFRPGTRVYDPIHHRLYGYATQELGWLEIQEVYPESSIGLIRVSRSEVRRGDHVRPRRHYEEEIEVGPMPDVEGRIVFTPDDRLNMGGDDVVFLDRGTSHGLEVGSPLEVYRPIGTAVDTVQKRKVALPDGIVAKLLVVKAGTETAVAVGTHAEGEVTRGDHFRGTDTLAWDSAR
jgi:hypothetical protein